MRWDGLVMTPSAAGRNKPREWVVSQGNEALMRFEESGEFFSACVLEKRGMGLGGRRRGRDRDGWGDANTD